MTLNRKHISVKGLARLLFVLFFFSLLLTMGCGKLKPLSGKVSFEDGSPLTKGVVVFTAGSNNAQGTLKEDGSYTVYFGEKKGIPAGQYQVSIIGAIEVGEADEKESLSATGEVISMASMNTNITPLIDSKFTRPESSGLAFTVDGSQKTFDITVSKP